MRRTLVSLFSSALLVLPATAFASTLDISTGVAEYQAQFLPSGATCAIASCDAVPVVGNPGWGAHISGATWVNASGTSDFNADNPNGEYDFYTGFQVNSTSLLSGSFASDNNATLFLLQSGSPTHYLASNSYGTSAAEYSFNYLTSFSDVLQPGYYFLFVDLHNGQSDLNLPDGPNTNGPVGLLIGASVTSVTPEPSSLVLLGSGILGLAGVARRRFVKV